MHTYFGLRSKKEKFPTKSIEGSNGKHGGAGYQISQRLTRQSEKSEREGDRQIDSPLLPPHLKAAHRVHGKYKQTNKKKKKTRETRREEGEGEREEGRGEVTQQQKLFLAHESPRGVHSLFRGGAAP